MTYRTVLVELTGAPSDGSSLAVAGALAARFAAVAVAVHVAPLPFMPVSFGEATAYVGPEVLAAQSEATEAARARLRQGLDMELVTIEGDRGQELARLARTADLTVLAAPDERGIEAVTATAAETVAVDAGGPVLVLPAGAWARPIGTRVVIGWNGSREAARGLKDALPFLAGAETVSLLCLDGEGGDLVDAVLATLGRHGVRADAVRAERGDRATGAALLAEAVLLGADLLVLGAYGRSRLREMLFGGATRDTMLTAPLPILYAA